MKLQSIKINNYKSLVDVEIKNPSPFTVFVGPNASGKSNIFEAIEFLVGLDKNSFDANLRLFGGLSALSNKKWYDSEKNYLTADDEIIEGQDLNFDRSLVVGIELHLSELNPYVFLYKPLETKGKKFPNEEIFVGARWKYSGVSMFPNETGHSSSMLKKINSPLFKQFIGNQSRVFIRNNEIEKSSYKDDKQLSLACGNLEKVLKRILKNESKKEEIVEWLQLLIPGFENIEIKSEELSGTDNLLIYEKGPSKPFSKNLISDGTFNIIALLTAVYQSDEPQFLCIEEPENGLNPKVVKELVGFFRDKCKEKGHYIWLNTHSETIVKELTTEEIIIVDKIDGATRVKQIQGQNLHGLRMDEALYSNAIGGGIPW